MQLDLFNNTIPLEDIFDAYYECRKNKRNKTGALQFEVDLEKNLIELWEEINSGMWEPRPSTVFIVDKPVVREIFAASFRDRIVHHFIIGRLNSIFEKQFIYDSYSCRKNKGTHFGVSRAVKFIRRNDTGWVLKIDLRGYFMSINRNILYRKLEKLINRNYHAIDKEMIKRLCKKVVFNDPTNNCIYHSPSFLWKQLPKDKSLFTSKNNCGLPIGNLTSQVFANFYLNEFDHFIKSECRIRNYGRYVDDCVIFHESKTYLKNLISKLNKYLYNNLKLSIHPRKIYLQPCQKGVKFLGCYIKPSHVVVNHRTFYNFMQKIHFYNKLAFDHKPEKEERASFISSVNSYLGILKHYKTYKKRKKIIKNNISQLWYKHIALESMECQKVIIRGKIRKRVRIFN